MTRHIIDHRTPAGGARVKEFLRVEKTTGSEGSHPASRMLHGRAHQRNHMARVKQFLRIARGHMA